MPGHTGPLHLEGPEKSWPPSLRGARETIGLSHRGNIAGPNENQLDQKKFGKQIMLKFIRQICINCVTDLENEFLVKFYTDLIGY